MSDILFKQVKELKYVQNLSCFSILSVSYSCLTYCIFKYLLEETICTTEQQSLDYGGSVSDILSSCQPEIIQNDSEVGDGKSELWHVHHK